MIERNKVVNREVDEAGAAAETADRGMASADGEGARLAVLRVLAANPEVSQRELARRLGISLGKTHYLLHALLDKGQVKIRNFSHSDRKMAYAYLLTPRGLAEKLRLTQRFLERKEREFKALHQTIATLRNEMAHLEDSASRATETTNPTPQ